MPSHGFQLLHDIGLRQCSYFRADCISESERCCWIDSRSDPSRRGARAKYQITNEDLLIVISQDCDISCGNDGNDPLVELVVCKPIDSYFHGNTYAHSARTLQFHIGEQWYEAKVANIVYVRKDKLSELLSPDLLNLLPEPAATTFPQWRSLRYNRTALPNAFNEHFLPKVGELTSGLDSIGIDKIRAIYVWLDNYEEAASYHFELLALLRDDVSDEDLSNAIECVEEFSYQLEQCGQLHQLEGAHVYFAARTDQILVSELIKFVRINLDYLSLEDGDDDVSVDIGS